MKLPSFPMLERDWPVELDERWHEPVLRLRRSFDANSGGKHLTQERERLRTAVLNQSFNEFSDALKYKRGVLATVSLWIEDDKVRELTCKAAVLEKIVSQHDGRLTRLTLSSLCSLYLTEYDRLPPDFLVLLSRTIHEQSQPITTRKANSSIWRVAKELPWVFSAGGPSKVVAQVHQEDIELEVYFKRIGLSGYDRGRFGDVCRIHYYLETLRALKVGEWHEVMDELLKPSVSGVPYEGDRLIGHEALSIIIDRVGFDVPDSWRNFVLDVAGDPRMSTATAGYRKWWSILGEERVDKVKSWLYKFDLKLFLAAVEQFGVESGKADLQRMFPARKRFMEGLLNLGMVRRTRLMLGATAEWTVKRMLQRSLNMDYVQLTGGQMNDKAVIYVDCGSFVMVEGSHSFKLWLYLREPDDRMVNTSVKSLTHFDLTRRAPDYYRRSYDLPYADITHHETTWHNRAFEFLGKNGIALDIEALMSPEDYRYYIRRFGAPWVSQTVRRPMPSQEPDSSTTETRLGAKPGGNEEDEWFL